MMEKNFQQLQRFLCDLETDRFVAFERHIGFIKKDAIRFGRGNLRDILINDLPEIKRKYMERLKTYPHLDFQLKKECENLMINGEFDSVIRKAFIVFKDRAVKNFNLPCNLDGEALVNRLFHHDNGLIEVSAERSKRKAFKDFCVGLFQYYRNDFAHNLGENPEHSVEIVLSSINMFLRMMDKKNAKSRKQS